MQKKHSAFTLVEVVLAIGVLTFAVVALLGLMGAGVSSVKDITDYDQATLATSRINSFIDSADFEDIFNMARDGREGSNALYFYSVQEDLDDPVTLGGPFEISTDGSYYSGSSEDRVLNAQVTKESVLSLIESGDLFGASFIVAEIEPAIDDVAPIKNLSGQDASTYVEGYIAFWVNVYAIPIDDEEFELTEENQLFSFPAAKVR